MDSHNSTELTPRLRASLKKISQFPRPSQVDRQHMRVLVERGFAAYGRIFRQDGSEGQIIYLTAKGHEVLK